MLLALVWRNVFHDFLQLKKKKHIKRSYLVFNAKKNNSCRNLLNKVKLTRSPAAKDVRNSVSMPCKEAGKNCHWRSTATLDLVLRLCIAFSREMRLSGSSEVSVFARSFVIHKVQVGHCLGSQWTLLGAIVSGPSIKHICYCEDIHVHLNKDLCYPHNCKR